MAHANIHLLETDKGHLHVALQLLEYQMTDELNPIINMSPDDADMLGLNLIRAAHVVRDRERAKTEEQGDSEDV